MTTAPVTAAHAATHPARTSLIRRAWGVIAWFLVIAVVLVWAVALRPQFLGGPTAIVVVSGNSMEPGMHTGDLAVVRRQDSYRRGDVVAYRIPGGDVGKGRVVIHRIAGGSGTEGFVLRGDNRTSDDQWRPTQRDIVGKKWLHASGQGSVMSAVLSPLGIATAASLLAFLLVATGGRRRPDPPAG